MINHNGFVYLWKNLINGKAYIGSHWGHKDDGYVGSGVLFKKAVKKYGIDNFIRILLEIKEYKNEKELRDSEHFYLSQLNVVNKSYYYNLTQNAKCSKQSLESRLKQSKTITGRKQSESTINKRISKMQGVNHPQFKGIYVTPKGEFYSSVKAAENFDISYKTIIKKCRENKNGWYFIPKEEI